MLSMGIEKPIFRTAKIGNGEASSLGLQESFGARAPFLFSFLHPRSQVVSNYTRKPDLNIQRILWDGTFIAAAFPLSAWATHAIYPQVIWMDLLWMPLLYAIVFLFTMNNHGLYEASTFTYQDRTLRGVTSSCLAASALCTIFLLFMPQTDGNTDFLAFYSLIGVMGLGLRYYVALAYGQRSSNRNGSQLLLAGTPQQMREYLFYLDKTSFHVNPIGFLSENISDSVRDLPRLGGFGDLKIILQQKVVDEVVLAWPQDSMEHVNLLLHECTQRGLLAKVALDVWDAAGTKCHVHSVGPIPVITYHCTNPSRFQQYVKRGFDIFTGLVGMLVTLLFAVPIVLFISLDSKGPVLVKLPRIGLNGRHFNQWCFRITKQSRDPSSQNPEDFTRVGRPLFQSKLQFLPSLWNVFKGDMSLVGTKGSMQCPVNVISQQSVPSKPGLTGLWHIKDFDRLLDEEGIAQLDIEYAQRWSLMLDLQIIVMSPIVHIIHNIIGKEFEKEERA